MDELAPEYIAEMIEGMLGIVDDSENGISLEVSEREELERILGICKLEEDERPYDWAELPAMEFVSLMASNDKLRKLSLVPGYTSVIGMLDQRLQECAQITKTRALTDEEQEFRRWAPGKLAEKRAELHEDLRTIARMSG